jgi:hypothetical protein
VEVASKKVLGIRFRLRQQQYSNLLELGKGGGKVLLTILPLSK